MTHQDVMAMLKETNLPFAYDHFAEGEAPDPPFLLFLFPASENFSADNIAYVKFKTLHLELYTEKKDPVLEEQIETILETHELFWSKSEVYIDSERLYEILYTLTV